MHSHHSPGLDFVRQLLSTDDSAEREPICKTLEGGRLLSRMIATQRGHTNLGNDHDIWSHPTIFNVKHASCPAEATLHLVDDEQQAMFVADGTQSFQESWWRRNVATFAQNGLNDNRRGVRGS